MMPPIPGQEATLNWPEQTEPHRVRVCEECGQAIDGDDWHSTEDGPVHEDCCSWCRGIEEESA